MHRIPAGLPSGIPGMGEDIDGAMQHAPQFGRHFMSSLFLAISHLHDCSIPRVQEGHPISSRDLQKPRTRRSASARD